jgi:hypothetical protein
MINIILLTIAFCALGGALLPDPDASDFIRDE